MVYFSNGEEKVKIFRVDDNVKSYKAPIAKMILSILVIVALILRIELKWFVINNLFWDIVLRVLSVIIFVLSIMRIYISFAEIIEVSDRRDKERANLQNAKSKSKTFHMVSVISRLEKNDIIEIAIAVKDQIVYIGASAECKNGETRFFDKKYYIDDEEIDTLDEVKERLSELCEPDGICVISIDGIPPSKPL